jgi:hypothetical protein
MKKICFLLLLLLSFEIIQAQGELLSDNAEISVLTVGPGTELNDAFGHSAFRIKDLSRGLDVVYGYGQYDFDSPNFYLKFAQGKLDYLISKTDFNHFYQVYVYYNRSIKSQVLNLSKAEKQKLYDFLVNNYKPENRRYLYEFFFDNCATRIKNVTNIAVNNSIIFNKPKGFQDATFRSLIYDNVNKNSWGSFGIDLALGSVIDRQATPEEHMFLPENIYKFFEVATIKKDGKPLVSQSHILYSQKPFIKSSSFITSPVIVLSIIGLFIVFITYKDYKNKIRSNWLDVTIFIVTGTIGVVILLLWFATDHTGTHQNYNLLWAFVLNLFVIRQLFKEKPNTWFGKYLKLLVIMLCLLTLHWVIGVQVFAIALIPLVIALFIRYIFLVKYFNKN